MFTPLRLFVISLIIFSTGTVHAASSDSTTCMPPAGSEQLWQHMFVIVGEEHGTTETPAVFAELVCAAAAQGKRVLVGLEFPEEQLPVFTAYLASMGTGTDRQEFVDGAQWGLQSGDGRTSVAVFAMLERLRELKAAGLDIDVTTFVRSAMRTPDESQTVYERALAASLEQARGTANADLLLVLVGNVHASKAPIPLPGAAPLEPMAMHLGGELRSLWVVHQGGESWNCTADGCNAHAVARRTPVELADKGVVLDAGLAPGFDGVLAIGTITASAPYRGE